jgi:hypothetical protein
MMRDKPEKPENIPADPNRYYKDQGWKGMGHWLGTGTTRFGSFAPFAKARAFARSLRLSSAKKWFLFCKGGLTGIKSKPANIPFDPQRIYKDEGWINWGDWLGTGTVSTQARSFMAFTEARDFVHTLSLASASEWFSYCKGKIPGKPEKPDSVPTYPAETYKDKGWHGMRDWLGN